MPISTFGRYPVDASAGSPPLGDERQPFGAHTADMNASAGWLSGIIDPPKWIALLAVLGVDLIVPIDQMLRGASCQHRRREAARRRTDRRRTFLRPRDYRDRGTCGKSGEVRGTSWSCRYVPGIDTGGRPRRARLMTSPVHRDRVTTGPTPRWAVDTRRRSYASLQEYDPVRVRPDGPWCPTMRSMFVRAAVSLRLVPGERPAD
jgi:hypothetical protein